MTFSVEEWLRRALQALHGSGASAIEESIALSDQLAEIGEKIAEQCGQAARFFVESHVWISSRFEEAEVEIVRSNGLCEVIRVCLVPMAYTTIRAKDL